MDFEKLTLNDDTNNEHAITTLRNFIFTIETQSNLSHISITVFIFCFMTDNNFRLYMVLPEIYLGGIGMFQVAHS